MPSPPKPCCSYNDGGCKRGEYCTGLHICKDYILGKCRPGCRNDLNHQLNVRQVKRVLEEAGINPNKSKAAVLAELTGNCEEDQDSVERELPGNWSHSEYKRKPYTTITLNKWSPEYANVKKQFSDAMKGEGAKVKSIMRVQNPKLWRKFDAKRRGMENDFALQLYHGTRQANVASICLNGFDPDQAGKNTNVLHHGVGVYFTSQAFYAAKGEFQDPNNKVVFFADVLVGDYIKGNRESDSAPEGYDTCVDHVRKPTKYVKFDKYSSYPTYVIYFR